MFYVHYNFHAQIIVMNDDPFGHDTCLVLYQLINFKVLWLTASP